MSIILTIDDVLISQLPSIAGMTDLIGDRINPEAGDQGDAYPFLTYETVGHTRNKTLIAICGLGKQRMYITSHDQDKRRGKSVIDLIDSAWEFVCHTDWIVNSELIRIQHIIRNDRFSDYVDPIEGKHTGIYLDTIDLTFVFDESRVST